jgi:hypothetical protein
MPRRRCSYSPSRGRMGLPHCWRWCRRVCGSRLGDRVQAPVVLDEIRKRDVVLTAVATTTTPSRSADLARRTGLVREERESAHPFDRGLGRTCADRAPKARRQRRTEHDRVAPLIAPPNFARAVLSCS